MCKGQVIEVVHGIDGKIGKEYSKNSGAAPKILVCRFKGLNDVRIILSLYLFTLQGHGWGLLQVHVS